MFNQRAVQRVAGFTEFHDPLRAVDLEQGLGPSATECRARRDQEAQVFAHRLAGLDLPNQFVHCLHVGQHRQWAIAARQIFARRSGNAQCAEAMLAREVRARGRIILGRQELAGLQRQVFAQRDA